MGWKTVLTLILFISIILTIIIYTLVRLGIISGNIIDFTWIGIDNPKPLLTSEATKNINDILSDDYPKYEKTYEAICKNGININIPKGSIGKFPVVGAVPNNDKVIKVAIPCQ